MKTVASLVLGLVSAVSVVACGASGDQVGEVEGVDRNEDGIASADSSTFFLVTHPDYRKCAYPFCGGWFVERVNRATTKCADGEYAEECHVLQLDLSDVGIVGDQRYEVQGAFGMRRVLVRGAIETRIDELGHEVATLVASEAWMGGVGAEPTGVFYRAELNGVKCITWPCPSFDETKLNSSAKVKAIAELDLTSSGADEATLEAAWAQLSTPDGILVAGKHATIKGPAGKGTVLVASELYTQIVPKEVCPGGSEICGALCNGQPEPVIPEGCAVPACDCFPPADDRDPASGQCVKNSNDSCDSDADCVAGGCGGELCFNPASGGGISTCECTQPKGVACGCVNGSCTWWN